MRDAATNSIGSKHEYPKTLSSLKRFLVASVVPYYYYCCFSASAFRVEGLLLGTNTNTNRNNCNYNYNERLLRKCSSNDNDHSGSGLETFSRRNGVRLFSTSASDANADSRKNDSVELETTFATDYHAPVMVNECLDALLDCQRGRIRNPNPKSYKKKKKMKKPRKHLEIETSSDSNSNSETRDNASTAATTQAVFAPDAPPLVFVDGTLGGGGHSNALLRRLRPGDILFGCDVDPNALQTASERLAEYTNHSGTDKPLFVPVATNFGDLAETLPRVVHPFTGKPILGRSSNGDSDSDENDDEDGDNDNNNDGGVAGVDGILLDLGVSSHQIDEPERGFSFMRDGPLDMRMGSTSSSSSSDNDNDNDNNNNNIVGGLTAADICNEFDESELQRIFSVYGDEPRAKTIAKAIKNHNPLHTTGELVEAIASVTPQFAKNKRHGKTATCARIFQSLRIVVNNEDGVLSRVLSEACPSLLQPGGRLVIMSYHSMEDRATKRIMRDGTLDLRRNSNRNQEKDMYGNYIGPPKPFQPVEKRRKATEEEIARNPRARSAILRVAERQDNHYRSSNN